ncbi:MAG: hypothetical protein HOV81_18175 [Kofleriaceae bacterium]|nr:hypothetical protein [Kofleriaceae bacterium]
MRALVSVAVLAAMATPANAKPEAPSSADQDKLWALAPADTVLGVVVSPAGVARVEGATQVLGTFFKSVPELAPFQVALDRLIPPDTFGAALSGVSHDQGFALFVVHGFNGTVLIVPLAARATFLAAAKGTQGKDGIDTIGTTTCKSVKGVYACSPERALLDRLGSGNGELKKRVVELAGRRGDIELAGVIPMAPNPPFAAAVQLDRGAFTVHGAVSGAPEHLKKLLVNATPPTRPNTVGFAIVNFKPFLAGIPSTQLAPGVDAADLARSIDGALSMTIGAGEKWFDARMQLNDTGPMQRFVDQCNKIAPLSTLGASVADHTCHVSLPQLKAVPVDVWIEGKEVRVGKKGAKPSASRVAMTPIGKEMAGESWILAAYGRGIPFAGGWVSETAFPPQSTPMLRLMMLVNELGLGVRMDGDKLQVVFSVRTIFANPDDVVRKFVALDPLELVNGKALPALTKIADGAKQSPLAGDVKSGLRGVVLPMAVVAGIAGYVVPQLANGAKGP